MPWLRRASELHVQPLLFVVLEWNGQQRSDPRECLPSPKYFGRGPPIASAARSRRLKVICSAIGFSGNCPRDEKCGCCSQPANEHRLGRASERWRTGKAAFDVTKDG